MTDKEITKFVGNKIKEFRLHQNLTQRELGLKVKKTYNTISDYENGITQTTHGTLFALAKALNVSVDEFFPPIEIDQENRAFLNKLNATLQDSN